MGPLTRGARRFAAPVLVAFVAAAAAFAAAAAPSNSAQADYPSKPVRFVVPAAPGLATDVIGRLFADEYGRALGQPVYVENKSGAGGELGAAEVAAAAPDGYTLLFSSASVLYGNKWLYPRRFDQDKDLVPVIEVSDSPMVLLAGPQLRGRPLKQIVEMAKAARQPMAFGAASTFSVVVHGAFQEAAQAPFLLVRYNSNQQAFIDLNHGDLQLLFEAIPSAQPMIASGRVVPLAVSSARRVEALPNVPTLRELGYDIEITGFNAIAGPKGLPPDVIALMNRTGNEILKHPELQKKLAELSTEIKGGTPGDMARAVRDNSALWGRMIQKFNLKD